MINSTNIIMAGFNIVQNVINKNGINLAILAMGCRNLMLYYIFFHFMLLLYYHYCIIYMFAPSMRKPQSKYLNRESTTPRKKNSFLLSHLIQKPHPSLKKILYSISHNI
jgi:hypothetical protein